MSEDLSCPGCGTEFDSEAGRSGHMKSCPDVDQPDGDGDGNDHRASLEGEINAILPGREPLRNLTAEQTGPVHYSVLSGRNGSVTVYRVNIAEVKCTCPDYEYNRDTDEFEVCAHLAKALLMHPQITAEEAGMFQVSGHLEEMRSLVDEIQEERDRARDASTEAGAAQRAAEASQTATETMPDVSPSEAADDLQEAFDGVVEDMQVKATDSAVWVQTGRDTPDKIDTPGPGGQLDVFETFLQNADLIHFVGERGSDFNYADEKPGEWWKNALYPDDVEDYISEVLE